MKRTRYTIEVIGADDDLSLDLLELVAPGQIAAGDYRRTEGTTGSGQQVQITVTPTVGIMRTVIGS